MTLAGFRKLARRCHGASRFARPSTEPAEVRGRLRPPLLLRRAGGADLLLGQHLGRRRGRHHRGELQQRL